MKETAAVQYTAIYKSPLGEILLAGDDVGLTGLWFAGQKYYARGLGADHEEKEHPVLIETRRWLDIYFDKREPDFMPALHMIGTPFQKSIWELLLRIPYGKVTTYGQLAKDIAKSMGRDHMSAQAVGGAVGHNPISIIIPCHRVMGSDGSLTGYAGGIDRKVSLLTGEGVDLGKLSVPVGGKIMQTDPIKQTENASVKIALIGAGSMGRKYALMIDSGAVPHMKLTAVCCRSREAHEWAEANLNSSVSIYPSTEELYGHPEEYDSVLIATPHPTHADLGCRAFALGKHVFCDKPAGISVEEAERMSQAARAQGRVYAMMFHQRLYAVNQRIHEILESGQLGEIFRITMRSTGSYRTSAYHNSKEWRSSWSGEGGGALINQGQHPLDLWQWFFGMPEEICASIPFGKYNDFEVDDEAEILMKYSGKKTGSFFISTGEVNPGERLEVAGSRGTLLMEGDRLTVCRYGEDSVKYGRRSGCHTRDEMSMTEETEDYPVKKNHEGMLENFARAILYGEPLIAPGEDGAKALALANGAYLSAWTGRWISLPLDKNLYEQELKKRIQAENHPVCRVTTLCHLERDGKYLMLHRVSKEHDENKDKWVGVGGHVKKGESPEDCLLREVKEETGLTLTSYRFRGLVTFVSDQWGTEYMCLYTADQWTGEQTECDEGILQWVEKEKVCQLPVWEGDKIFFRLLKEEAPFFSLKLRYEGDCLAEAVLDGNVLEKEE